MPKVPEDHKAHKVLRVLLDPKGHKEREDLKEYKVPKVLPVELGFKGLEVHKELKGHEVLKVHRVARVLWVTLEQGVPKGQRVVKDSKEHKVL